MTVSFYTFGCKLNQCETEAIASAFETGGFYIASPRSVGNIEISSKSPPHICVINTCTVTSKSEQKARKLIRKLRQQYPESILIITGCYAEVDASALKKLDTGAWIVGQKQKGMLMTLPKLLSGTPPTEINAIIDAYSSDSREIDDYAARFSYRCEAFPFHTRPFIKIQDGCNNGCAYCRIPQSRGPSRSIEPMEAVAQVARLEQLGYKEVVLTGVNISDYTWKEIRLPALLQQMLMHSTSIRLRLSSMEPDRITEDLLDVLGHSRICPHFHIPIQSGSSDILEGMNRHYSAETVEKVVCRLRKIKKDPFIGADILVGFPGETSQEFEKTRALVERLDVSKLHIFQFSPRPGTAALRTKGKVPERIVKERMETLWDVSRSLHTRYLNRWVGKEVNVLLEHTDDQSNGEHMEGVSENYLKVTVHDIPQQYRHTGTLSRTELTAVDPAEVEMEGSFLGIVKL